MFPRRVRGSREPAPSGRSPPARSGVLVIPRKEVIQPQVLLRLPCYDLVPVTGITLGASALAVRSAT